MNNVDFYYRILDLILVTLTYAAYKVVKKYKIKLIRFVMFSSSIIYFITFFYLELSKSSNDYIKTISFILAIISLIVFYKSKQDIRGNKIIELINNQNIWENKECIFKPKDFTDKEINSAKKVLEDIFYEINKKLGYRKIGKQTISIKKNQNANILYNDNEKELNLIKDIYNEFAKKYYGEVNIKNGFIPEIELRILI